MHINFKLKKMVRYYHKKLFVSLGILTMMACFYGCKEDVGITVNRSGEVPGQVSNIHVTPISGGAIIRYDLPVSEDLRYVKATYSLDNGIVREAKSSIYKNEITVDGFGREGSYNIELRSVAVGEVESEAQNLQVDVLRPPHLLVLDKMREEADGIVSTFGGLNLNYVNETRANIVVRVIKRNNNEEWESVDNTYTNFESGTIRVRGQAAEATDFGIYIEDRWDHVSDTLTVNLTPIEEVAIPTTAFARLALPNDAAVRASGFPFTGIWDGNVNAGYLSTSPNIELPNSITIDMGIAARLSRMQIWATRAGTLSDVYGASHLYDFEIFGSNAPNSTGEWDESWTSLGRFVSERPSGYGFNVPATSAEQTNIQNNGETYEFPDPMAFDKFRYIRFKNYATWNGAYEGSSNFFIFELRLFGQL